MSSLFEPHPAPTVITVSELNGAVRNLLEQNFPLTWIAGEISNFTQAPSGHCYFSLKDAKAQVRCVMFRSRMQFLDWKPENGTQVEVRALVSLYEARGEFQLTVENMRRAGLGALYEAFAQLKVKLELAGLFDKAWKKPLPPYPRSIGIVTSPAAAALHDVLSTLSRRMPGARIILYPTAVQGKGAGTQIATAVHLAEQRRECDVLIICRGGGSIEDLWAFNDEGLAQAIFACSIPIVSGVGHETDFTICDFVADVRAATPTAAAEHVSIDSAELKRKLVIITRQLQHTMARSTESRMQQLDYLSRRLIHPGQHLKNQSERLTTMRQRLTKAWRYSQEKRNWDMQKLEQQLGAARPAIENLNRQQTDLARRLRTAVHRQMENSVASIHRVKGHLQHLSPQAVLERGYSLVETQAGVIVRDSIEINQGEQVKITFSKGSANALVVLKD